MQLCGEGHLPLMYRCWMISVNYIKKFSACSKKMKCDPADLVTCAEVSDISSHDTDPAPDIRQLPAHWPRLWFTDGLGPGHRGEPHAASQA